MKGVNYFKTSLFALIAIIVISCSKNEESQQSAIIVQDEQSLTQTMYADQTQASSTISFTSAGAWTSTITEIANTKAPASPDWVSVAPNSGDEAGDYSLAIHLDENGTGAERSAKIAIFCEGEQKEITITQKSTTSDGKPYEKKYDIYVLGNLKNKNEWVYWKNGEKILVANNVYDDGFTITVVPHSPTRVW